MILEVETPECKGHNFLVAIVGAGRVPQIKNSPRESSIFENCKLLLEILTEDDE